jgi:hypothetical protein
VTKHLKLYPLRYTVNWIWNYSNINIDVSIRALAENNVLFSEVLVLGEHYHASSNFIEVPLLYEPKKYKRYLSGICHINSFNENVVFVYGL